jgi:hypothetical protein
LRQALSEDTDVSVMKDLMADAEALGVIMPEMGTPF